MSRNPQNDAISSIERDVCCESSLAWAMRTSIRYSIGEMPHTSLKLRRNFPAYDFSKVITMVKEKLSYDSKIKKPLIPTVVTGWDPSPRTLQSDIYENVGYPFTAIGINNSPTVLKNNLHEIHKVAQRNKAPFMTITAWNEWTEGNYLEPCQEYGYGMLEAVKAFKEEVLA